MTQGLDDRYGRADSRRRLRIGLIAGGTALAVAVVAWSVWTGVGGAASSMEVATSGFTVESDRAVTVEWTVTGRPSTALVCAVEAQDSSGVVLGLREVAVPADGSAVRNGTTAVRTTRQATTGLIDSCRPA